MATQNKHWQTMVQPMCAAIKMPAQFGHSYVMSPNGCMAYAAILSAMAMHLDKSNDRIIEIATENIELRKRVTELTPAKEIPPGHKWVMVAVTLEGNDA